MLQTLEFRSWLDGLADRRAQVRIAARIRMAESGNLGDWKSISGPLCEMRVHVGAGYRLYFVRRGTAIVILLAGGDKSTQKRDVAKALQIAERL